MYSGSATRTVGDPDGNPHEALAIEIEEGFVEVHVRVLIHQACSLVPSHCAHMPTKKDVRSRPARKIPVCVRQSWSPVMVPSSFISIPPAAISKQSCVLWRHRRVDLCSAFPHPSTVSFNCRIRDDVGLGTLFISAGPVMANSPPNSWTSPRRPIARKGTE